MNPVEAVKSTWTHRQYTQLGFELIPKMGIVDMATIVGNIDGKRSLHGNPSTKIYSIYKMR